ncbi:ProQ/FINO family protein [Vreelandella aquamarina]|uniref:ProQ/FINO family protein n=1 Tax=Vreelandella aquamarina TaxID=77097 RepID=UPI00384B8370
MAASVLHLLETLEARLEQKNAEITALREENERLRQQLAAVAALSASSTSDVARASVAKTDVAMAQEAPADISAQTPSQAPVQPSTQAPSPQALLKQWYQRYPNAFFKGHTKPLKVGIHQDLAEREPWSGKLIRRALANYVNLPRYIKSMREGAERVDLDGNPAGKVDKEAAQHASERRKEAPEKKAAENATPHAQKSPTKAVSPAKKTLQRADEQRPKAVVEEKDEQRKPLSFEEKLKGLQQKFERH